MAARRAGAASCRRGLEFGHGRVKRQAALLPWPRRLGERRAAVQGPSFRSRADEAMYLMIGDAQGPPLPKSGHVACSAGIRVGYEIARPKAGETTAAPTAAVPLHGGICWPSVTHGEVIIINIGATFTPGQAPKLNFQVDHVHSMGSGKGAVEWGRTT